MSDVHAEHAPGALMDPTDPRGTLGAHVVAAKEGARARVGGGVTVRDELPTPRSWLESAALRRSPQAMRSNCPRRPSACPPQP